LRTDCSCAAAFTPIARYAVDGLHVIAQLQCKPDLEPELFLDTR
jgi:hypothetical protein